MGLSNFNPSTGRVVKKQFTLNMRVVILLAVVAAAVCDFVPVPFDTCDKIDVVTAVALEPCEKVGGLCPLVRGKNVTLQFKFKAPANSQKLTAQVHGKIGFVWVPFPIKEKDVCGEKFGVTCPIQAGTEYTMHYMLHVETYFPAISVAVKWELIGDNNVPMTCLVFQTKLT